MFYPDKNFINTLSNGERFIFLKIICGTVAANRQVSRQISKGLCGKAALSERGGAEI